MLQVKTAAFGTLVSFSIVILKIIRMVKYKNKRDQIQNKIQEVLFLACHIKTINIYGSNELLPTFYVDIYVDIDKYITYKIHLAR